MVHYAGCVLVAGTDRTCCDLLCIASRMVFCGGHVCRIKFSIPKETKSEQLIRKGIRNDKEFYTNHIVALFGGVGNAVSAVSGWKAAVLSSGETDHADGNDCLVCQYPDMDVGRKRAIT